MQISKKHAFSKPPADVIRLIENFGVDGDAHAGAADQHLYHIRRFGHRPNLRQVHLIQTELFDELSGKGHRVRPGDLGENVSTRNIDLLGLPTGTRLRLGPEAVIELTGLRNPCHQIETFQPGLLKHVVKPKPTGLVRRAGVMSIVLKGGDVRPGDPIEVELPPLPHEPLIYRVPELELRISTIRREAEGIHSLELRALDDGILPPFTAGSHIDLLLAPNLTRSYSLSNDPQQRDRYVVSVMKDPGSRGGSRHVHEDLRVSDRIRINPPRNNFKLDETAQHTVLIAGGIGITPLMAMIHRLGSQGLSWQLFYAAKNRAAAAFLDELQHLESLRPGRVRLHFGAEANGARLDLAAIVSAAPAFSHFYCCGPQPMIAAFEEATVALPRSQIHVEHFARKGAPATAGGFEIRLHRSKLTLKVGRGSTILETLLAARIDVPHSCKEGVCGSCKVRVLEGLPDHRDQVLSPDEHARNDQMITCCSGTKTPSLVLDL
ncbi:2Fe-2S iron-sulfur cluster-binding protein [Bradyrhizobium prioriisuperbiae]|uniref:2Fe-2S iron-sulfur cluster-binding protein n=1 Tax=Bradyrhizobium prioriisuperbiae TaxID=2854389 RepID=UPI0028F1248D|nr:2Fe-2S iron-sulfur cluster-binding protein [Bradyrhizobium prioritasuperba]